VTEVNSALHNITGLIQSIGLAVAILAACYLAIQVFFTGIRGIIALMTGLAGVALGLLVLFLAGPIGRALGGAIGTPQALVVLLPWT
jgi:hypothetical protein